MSILHIIQERLNQDQDLSFAEFMQMALYAPIEGYYSSGLQKLGKGGDFVTAPELSPLFGASLANQCQQILAKLTHVYFDTKLKKSSSSKSFSY